MVKPGLWIGLLVLAGCPVQGGGETGATEPGTSAGTTTGTGGVVTTGATAGTTADMTTMVEPQGPPMACPGVTPRPEPPCRVSADCEEFFDCVPQPDDCPGPGCLGDCTDDSVCMLDGAVCKFPDGGCCAAFGSCVPPCVPGGCEADEMCDGGGHCVPLACDDVFVCPQGQACAAGQPGSDKHGCAVIPCDQPGALACPVVTECVAGVCQRLACTVDADCPCGTCIQGACWERPWICDEGNA